MRTVSPHDVMIAYKQMAATPDGEVVLADLVRKFGYARNSTFNPGDPYSTVMCEGQRSVVVHIGRQVEGELSDVTDVDEQMGEM